MTKLPSTTDGTKRVAARQRVGPARSADEYIGFNGRLAAALTRRAGSMWVVYFTIVFMLAWMGLATFGPPRDVDPYPFPFLLFIGNVVQLLLVFVILVGQQVLGRAADPGRDCCPCCGGAHAG